MLFISLVVFFIFPTLSAILTSIFFLTKKKRQWVYLFLFSISISILSLYFIPHYSFDAHRYYSNMDMFSMQPSLRQLFSLIDNANMEYKNTPVIVILMYVISKTRKYTYISFVSIFLLVFTSLFPIILYQKKEIFKNRFYILVSLFLLTWINYLNTISGFRFYIGISLFLIIFYLEFFFKFKSRIFIWFYILPILVHPGLFLIVLPRLIVSLNFKINKRNIILGLLSLPTITIFSKFFLKIINNYYLQLILNRVLDYTGNGNLDFVTPKLNYVRLILGSIYTIFILISLFQDVKTSQGLKLKLTYGSTYIQTLFFFSLITISSIPFVNLFNRNISILVPFSGLYLLNVFETKNWKYQLSFFFILLTMIFFSLINNINVLSATFDIDFYKLLTNNIIQLKNLVPKR